MRTGFAFVVALGAGVTLLYAACGGDNNSSSVDAGTSDGAKKSDGASVVDGGDASDAGALASASVLRDPKVWSLIPAHQSCNPSRASR